MWLRAHARKRRWEEEVVLVPFEMECMERAFENRVAQWELLATSLELPGHRAYAYKQAAVWRGLRDHASKMFAAARVTYLLPVLDG